jgi:hypothetical protein
MSAEDEDAALAELEAMEAEEEAAEDLGEEAMVPKLPDVPTEKLPEKFMKEKSKRVAVEASS